MSEGQTSEGRLAALLHRLKRFLRRERAETAREAQLSRELAGVRYKLEACEEECGRLRQDVRLMRQEVEAANHERDLLAQAWEAMRMRWEADVAASAVKVARGDKIRRGALGAEGVE